MSENDWTVYLVYMDGTSVRMNMRADSGIREGTLEWSRQLYAVSNSAIQYWDFPVVQPLQVHHFY